MLIDPSLGISELILTAVVFFHELMERLKSSCRASLDFDRDYLVLVLNKVVNFSVEEEVLN